MDFLPSTLATSALLLSVSRGTTSSNCSPSLSRRTSYADVLDTCLRGVLAAEAASPFAAGAAAAADTDTDATDVDTDTDADTSSSQAEGDNREVACLRRVLECVELLGSSLAKRYPAVAAAAASAAEGIARYAGFPLPASGGVGAAAVAAAATATTAVVAAGGSGNGGGMSGVNKPPKVSTTPVAIAKSRRCSTPTGVEGIMHIEMDAIRSGSGGGNGNSNSNSDVPVQQQPPSANEALGGKCSGGGGDDPTSVAMDTAGHGAPAAVAATTTATATSNQPQQQEQGRRRRPTPFATAAAAASTAPRQRVGRVRGGSFSYSDEDIAFARASKRSAEALGHSERGSGFGAPATRSSGGGLGGNRGGGGRVVGTGGGAKRAMISSSAPPLPSSSSSLAVVGAVLGGTATLG